MQLKSRYVTVKDSLELSRNLVQELKTQLKFLVDTPPAAQLNSHAHRERAVVRQEKEWQQKKADLEAEVNAARKSLKSITKFNAEMDAFKQQLKVAKDKTKVAEADAISWEESCAAVTEAYTQLANSQSLFELPFTTEQIHTWGTWVEEENDSGETVAVRVPYPTEIIHVVMELCSREVSAKQIPSCIRAILCSILPTFPKDFPLPSITTINNYRRVLQPLGNLWAAIVLANAVDVCLHTDGTTEAQTKYNLAIFQAMDEDGKFERVMAGGVFKQKGGTGKEGAQCVWDFGILGPQAVLESCQEYLKKHMLPQRSSMRGDGTRLKEIADLKAEIDLFFGSSGNFIEKLIESTITLKTMQDHASAQTAQDYALNQIINEFAEKLNIEFNNTTIPIRCWDHKRTNLADAMGKALHNRLEEKLGTELHPGEYGSNILEALIRECNNEFGHRKNPYEYGRGVLLFPGWMEIHHPKKWRGLLATVGNRNDVYFENAMTVLHMHQYYVEYMMYVEMVKPLNKMELKIRALLGTVEIIAALKAQGLMWVKVLQPLREESNSEDIDLFYLDMERYAAKTAELLEVWSKEIVFSSSAPAEGMCQKGNVMRTRRDVCGVVCVCVCV